MGRLREGEGNLKTRRPESHSPPTPIVPGPKACFPYRDMIRPSLWLPCPHLPWDPHRYWDSAGQLSALWLDCELEPGLTDWARVRVTTGLEG
jgi:hypothetical protein